MGNNMPKIKKDPVPQSVAGIIKKSRTLYMSDADWEELSALSEAQGRKRTAQIMHMVRKEKAN